MILKSLTLKNFRQYRDEQTIEFAQDSQRKVTLVHGVNGAGKTGLFMALKWCLYQVFPDQLTLINRDALERRGDGNAVEASVSLTFSDAQSGLTSNYEVKRSLTATTTAVRRPRFIVSVTGADNQTRTMTDEHHDAYFAIAGVLPENVLPYYFFDGEAINDFTKPGYEQQVEDAVRAVMRLQTLEKVIARLRELANDFKKEYRAIASPEARSLVDSELILRTNLERCQQRIDELKAERASAKRRRSELDEFISSFKTCAELQAQRKQVESEIESASAKIRKASQELRSTVSAMGPTILSLSFMVRADEAFGKAQDDGKLPAGVQPRFLDRLIQGGACICGRPLSEGDGSLGAIKALTHESSLRSDTRTLVDLAGYFANAQLLVSSTKKQLNSLQEALVTSNDSKNDQERLKENLSERIRAALAAAGGAELGAAEKVPAWEDERRALDLAISGFDVREGTLIAELSGAKIALEQHLKELQKHAEKDARARCLKEQAEIAQAASDTAERIYKEFAESMRIELQENGRHIFSKLIWKTSLYPTMTLSPRYELEVVDRKGRPSRVDLSAGERQVLSLSFIMAMAKVAGEDAPFVIDTPFGRLSGYPRETISRELPKLTRQLVLFLTDTEYSGEVRAELEPYVGREYNLEFDVTTGASSIERLK